MLFYRRCILQAQCFKMYFYFYLQFMVRFYDLRVLVNKICTWAYVQVVRASTSARGYNVSGQCATGIARDIN